MKCLLASTAIAFSILVSPLAMAKSSLAFNKTSFSRLDEEVPLFLKTVEPGYKNSAFKFSTRCVIYASHVTKTHYFNVGVKAEEVRNIKLQGTMDQLIKGAANGQIVQEQGPEGDPSINYTAYLVTTEQQIKNVQLFEQNGASGTILRNNSMEAATLTQLIDQICTFF